MAMFVVCARLLRLKTILNTAVHEGIRIVDRARDDFVLNLHTKMSVCPCIKNVLRMFEAHFWKKIRKLSLDEKIHYSYKKSVYHLFNKIFINSFLKLIDLVWQLPPYHIKSSDSCSNRTVEKVLLLPHKLANAFALFKWTFSVSLFRILMGTIL